MSPKSKGPILGAVYEFEPVPGIKLLLTPCELPTSGQAKGVVCAAYVFRPGTDIAELQANLQAEHLLLPVVMLFNQDFQAGAFRLIPTTGLLSVPIFTQHGFRSPYDRDFYDMNRQLVQVSGGAAGHEHLGPISLCKLIAEELGLDLDCESCWGYNSDYLRKLRRMFERNYPDDYVNRKKLMSIVAFAMPEHADSKLLDLLDELEETLGNQLENAKLGECTGRCIGAGIIDLDFEIRRGKYPEAVKLIREALLAAGISELTITSS